MSLHHKPHLLISTILFCLLTGPAHANFQAGKDAYDQGDYATALKEWQPLAEQGNGEAPFGNGWLRHKEICQVKCTWETPTGSV